MLTRRLAPRPSRPTPTAVGPTALGLAAVSLAVALSLTGCLPPGGGDEPSSSPSAPEPSTSVTPSSSPSEATDPEERPTPLSIPCASVVGAQTMYDFNPNFGLLDSFTPDANTPAARALYDEGTVCRWINQTSGATIDLGLSKPGPTAFAAAKAAAKGGTPVSGLGDEAYFAASGGVGVLQVFTGTVWISAASDYFSEPGDARAIMADAVAAAR